MYTKYSTKDYEQLGNQHNIMVMVGNGFDIAVLNKFGDKRMNGKEIDIEKIKEKIFIVQLQNNDNYFLGLKQCQNCQ